MVVRCGYPVRALSVDRALRVAATPPARLVPVGFLPWQPPREPDRATKHVTIHLSKDQEARLRARSRRPRSSRGRMRNARANRSGTKSGGTDAKSDTKDGTKDDARSTRRKSRRNRSAKSDGSDKPRSHDKRRSRSSSRLKRKALTIAALKRFSLIRLKEMCGEYGIKYEKKDTTCPMLLQALEKDGAAYV